MSLVDMGIPYSMNIIGTRRSSAIPKRFNVARGPSRRLAYMHRNKERSLKIIAKYSRLSDPKSIEEFYNDAITCLDRVPRAEPEDPRLERRERRIHGYIAHPELAERGPAMLLIHQHSGLTRYLKTAACRFTQLGYTAVIPNVYHMLVYPVETHIAEGTEVQNKNPRS